MKIKSVLLAIWFTLSFSLATAQKYNIKTYSVNDGLPSSQVYDVHLDDEGLVWFATAYGLVKFDGFNFETFGKAQGLRDELIYDIFEDSQDRFWVSTEKGGVGVLQGDSVIYDPGFSRLDTMLINYITESPAGDIWFGTDDDGILIWRDSRFSELSTENGLPSNQIWDIQFLNDNEVWIATMRGVAVYKKGEGIVQSWTQEEGLSGFAAYQVFEASDGTVWVPTSSGITLIDENYELQTITEIDGRPLEYVYNINEDNEGVIWIGTERRGLYWFDGEEYTHITKRNGLSSNYIYRLIKAEDGTIWVATDGNGVSIFKDKNFKFYGIDSEVRSNSIHSLFVDNEGTMWFGKEGGLGSYKDGKFTSYDIPKEIFEEDEIWDIEQLPNGNLLLLTYSYWIIEFDGEKFFRSKMNEPLMKYYINDIFVDDDGEIWVGTGQALINYKDGVLKEFKPSSKYWQSYINLIHKDKSGTFWVGTEGGLAKFDGKEFVFYTEKEGLKGQSIYEVKEDRKGNLWIGTNKGLSILENFGEQGSSQKIVTFETDDIFLPETISLLFDDNGGLWQGTNAGINYYDVEHWFESGEMDKVHYPLQAYGKGLEFNGAAAVVGTDGNLWFGTASRGLLQYNSEKIPTSIYDRAPTPHIRSVIVNGVQIYDQKDGFGSREKINLDYDQNNIEINFGAVNYKDPTRVLYRYKLDGFEKDWNVEFDKREATYTNLHPGNYSFSVMSKSVSSEWSSVTSTLNLQIGKPFWKTWWFIMMVFLGLSGLIWFYAKTYVSLVEKKRLRKLVDEKTVDLQSALEEKEVLIKEIHHRVKNNMAVVSGLLELQSWQMEEGLAKAAIENSRLRIKAMSNIHEKLYQSDNFADIDVQEFVADLVESIANSLKAYDKDIIVKQDIEVEKLDVNKAIPCGLLLNELISNAFEHAFPHRAKGEIEVVFKESGDQYLLQVKDDGIGLPDDILNQARSSLGLTLIESLTDQVYGELSIINKEGTTFRVFFPKESF